jgi:hypothetical protein
MYVTPLGILTCVMLYTVSVTVCSFEVCLAGLFLKPHSSLFINHSFSI